MVLHEEATMTKRRKKIDIDEPLRHRDHSKPRTRRDFLRQGFITGPGLVLTGGVFSLFTNPRDVHAAVAADLEVLRLDMNLSPDVNCNFGLSGTSKIPFICFDLGGGANLAGSNVLVGQGGGQRDFLAEGGYSKLGIPPSMIPGTSSVTMTEGIGNAVLNPSANTDYINDELGLLFHQDSPMLFGILQKFTSRGQGQTNGAVIPARSENDTGNNPHNPMYGIAKAGAGGDVVTLVGSQNTESGGRSVSPAALIDPKIRPTKVDRPGDVTGMVDVGDLTSVLSDPADVTAVMESMARITHKKLRLGTVSPDINPTKNEVIKDLMQCGYLKAADLAARFAGVEVSPDDRGATTPVIVNNAGGIFTETEFDGSGEFRKTASVMKMVIDGHSGAGSISMGGYDYHTGDRSTGENRDLRAGRCIGACLEYAARTNKPLMIYVFSDGSLSSNGGLDNSADNAANTNNPLGGRGKGNWTGDNSSTACSFYLLFTPTAGGGTITKFAANTLTDHHQIGRFSSDASVVTSSSPAANNVNLLVNTVIANYMAINGDITAGSYNNFSALYLNGNHGLGTLDNLISFGKITA